VTNGLRRQLAASRQETDALFNIVHTNALYERPIDERHRIVFYIGHLEVFDWNMICAGAFGMKPLHPEFERLFAFGIDPVDGKLPHDKPSDWPTLEQVRRYNAHVRQAVDDCFEKADSSKDQIFNVIIEHRLMHLETLSYMLHWLPIEMKDRPTVPPPYDVRPQPKPRQVRIPAGQAVLGLSRGHAFGWDNEFERNAVSVPEFEIDALKVTNREFREFIEGGGYEQRGLWTDDAWNWIQSTGIRHPKFWFRRASGNGHWWYRAMFSEMPLPESWPVYASHAEASAYARWRGRSLPTEAEFHRAAFGDTHPPAPIGNFGLQSWDPTPVDLYKDVTRPFGAIELIGNGWEWTSTPFAPFPGFERFPFYPGYSADFFDNKHFVMKGASPRTASRFTRPTFRNWFQPLYPYIYSAFRCVSR
jgi:ergothioneine biosynthesis protein EgtB